MISAKTLRVCREGKPVPTFPDHPPDTLPAQTSNRSRRSEHESARSSPSVPRGTPQCRHLTRVEGGAPSAESKTIPKESQLMQTILKAGRAIGACGTFAVFEIITTCSKLK